MLTSSGAKRVARPLLAAALLLGAALSANNFSEVLAKSGSAAVETVRFDGSPAVLNAEHGAVRKAVETFIGGMASGDAQTVWMFASEEEQDAFATEDAVYTAFAETFPALTRAAEVSFDSFTQSGDTPFVQLSLADREGNRYRAEIGMWRDDAGDWKVISCDVTAVSDRVAAL